MFKKLIFLFALVLSYTLSMGQTESLDIKGNIYAAAGLGDAAYFLVREENKSNFLEFNLISKELTLIDTFDKLAKLHKTDSQLVVHSSNNIYLYDNVNKLQMIYSSSNQIQSDLILIEENQSLLFWEKSNLGFLLKKLKLEDWSDKQLALLDEIYKVNYLSKRNAICLNKTKKITNSNDIEEIVYYIDSIGSLRLISEKFERNFQVVGEHDDFTLFRSGTKLGKTNDFTSIDYQTFAHFEVSETYNINYDGDIVYFFSGGRNREEMFSGFVDLNPPFTFTKVPISQQFSFSQANFFNQDQQKTIPLNDYFLTYHPEFGLELSFLSKNDSVRLIKDLNPGPASSVGAVYSPPPSFFVYHFKTQKDLYFVGTNGSTESRYFHFTDGDTIKSFFPVSNKTNKILLVHNGFAFWSEGRFNKDFTTDIVKYRDTALKEPQPENKPYNPKEFIGENNEGEWHRQVSLRYMKEHYNYLTRDIKPRKSLIDKEGNIYVVTMGEMFIMGLYSFDLNKVVEEQNGHNFIIKYNKQGDLLWAKSLNQSSWIQFNFNTDIAIDEDGNIWCSGVEYDFDPTLFAYINGRVNLYKISKEDGSILFEKRITESDNAGFSVENLVIDPKRDIYLTIRHSSSFQILGGDFIHAGSQNQTAVLKLDSMGNVLWSNPIGSDFLPTFIGMIHLKYNQVDNELILVCSQGNYNTSVSPCRGVSLKTTLLKIRTKDGQITKKHEFFGNDLNSTRLTTITKYNDLFMSGFYRSTLNFSPIYSETSNELGSCNVIGNFTSMITMGFVPKGFNASKSEGFYPFDIAQDKDFLYIIGSELMEDNSRKLSIRKYSHKGILEARRIFEYKVEREFEFRYFYTIAASDSFINIVCNSFDQIPPFTNYLSYDIGNIEPSRSLSIYKLNKNIGWEEVEHFTEEDKEKKVVFNPNPASEFVDIHFMGEPQYSELAIYDLSGRKIRTIVLNGDVYQRIYISDLSTGMYILRLTGKESYSHKLIKH